MILNKITSLLITRTIEKNIIYKNDNLICLTFENNNN